MRYVLGQASVNAACGSMHPRPRALAPCPSPQPHPPWAQSKPDLLKTNSQTNPLTLCCAMFSTMKV